MSQLAGYATASPEHKALFISLLGALAYTLLTRIDIAVFYSSATTRSAGPVEYACQAPQCRIE
eukprot:8204941-Lingulodinium_polyedra.AAC.1